MIFCFCYNYITNEREICQQTLSLYLSLPKSMTNSVTVFVHTPFVIENSRKIRQMTCGDQHAIKINAARTKIFASLLLDLSVEVCGIGNSAGGIGGEFKRALIC